MADSFFRKITNDSAHDLDKYFELVGGLAGLLPVTLTKFYANGVDIGNRYINQTDCEIPYTNIAVDPGYISNTNNIGNIFQNIRSYAIGDTGPAGGTIVYDKGGYSDPNYPTSKLWRYFEAAPLASEVSKLWSSGSYNVATISAIGNGKPNTVAIKNALVANSETDKAAQICDSYSYGGLDDWFLPTEYEFHAIYTACHVSGAGSFSGYYWTSKQNLAASAYYYNYTTGIYDWGPKNTLALVRPIRRF